MPADKIKIVVTGANGQLGKEIRELANLYSQYSFHFLSRSDLPIHHFELVRHFFDTLRPDYCINCAAYTAVDKAEDEPDLAMLVNAESVSILAAVCREHKTRLIHISTDYVFNGQSPEPHLETDATDPVNLYGATKLEGEKQCLLQLPEALVVRTSWVYSEFGNNFVKTMLRLMDQREYVHVVNDQHGAPTYAADLAHALLHMLSGPTWQGGIFHYCNSGQTTWYHFAEAIARLSGSACQVIPIPSAQYPTKAKRPFFSLLDTTKIRTTYGLSIPDWQNALERCLKRLNRFSGAPVK